MSILKDYLGDSVYVDFDGFGIIMTTENGAGPTNTIYLEPATLEALDRYKQKLIDYAKEHHGLNPDCSPPDDPK